MTVKLRTLLAAAMFMALAVSAQAQVIFEENFNYTAGTALTANGWTAHSSGGTNPQTVLTPGLTYTNYPGSGIGGAVRLSTSGEDLNRTLTDSITSGNVYASMLVRIDTAKTGDYFFHLGPRTISTTYRMRVFVKLAANGNLAFGLSKSSTSAAVVAKYSDSVYALNTTYLIVAKYVIVPGADNDSVCLWVNPVIGTTEPRPNVTHTDVTAGSDISVGTVALRQGAFASSAYLVVDGIRLSTAWASVLPVEFTSFSANSVNGSVVLNWSTATEVNNYGFEVQRKVDNGSFVTVGFKQGNGTTTENKTYSYTDNVAGIKATSLTYRLKQIDFGGAFAFSKEVVLNGTAPTEFSLGQNYPNPFNPSTVISFSIPAENYMTLKVFNALGSEVATLLSSKLSAGSHKVSFDASKLSGGIYYYTLSSADGSVKLTKKMTLIK